MPTKERLARERARKQQPDARRAPRAPSTPPAKGVSPNQMLDMLRAAGLALRVVDAGTSWVVPADGSAAIGSGGSCASVRDFEPKTAQAPAPVRELPAELDMLHMALGELDQAVDRLEVQLQPISRPEPVSEKAMPDVGGIPPMSDVAHQIRAARYRVERLLSVVTSRAERLGV